MAIIVRQKMFWVLVFRYKKLRSATITVTGDDLTQFFLQIRPHCFALLSANSLTVTFFNNALNNHHFTNKCKFILQDLSNKLDQNKKL
jgi:hypothetical protein